MANAADVEIDDSLYRYDNNNNNNIIIIILINTHWLIPRVTFKLVSFKLIYPGKHLDLLKEQFN